MFDDDRESLSVPVATWEAHKRSSPLTVLRKPGQGPDDFHGHQVKAIAMPVSHTCTLTVLSLPFDYCCLDRTGTIIQDKYWGPKTLNMFSVILSCKVMFQNSSGT